MLNRFFNMEDFEDPIGESITDKFYYTMMPGNTKQAQIYVKENNLELMDSFMQYGSAEKKSFYSLTGGYVDLQSFKGNTYLNAFFLLDSERTTYKRTVLSFLDMLAQLGGVYSVVEGVIFLFLGFYSERMMYYCILKKAYQFNNIEPIKRLSQEPDTAICIASSNEISKKEGTPSSERINGSNKGSANDHPKSKEDNEISSELDDSLDLPNLEKESALSRNQAENLSTII